MSDNMSYAEVLEEMQEIRARWRANDFEYIGEDQERYEFLLQVRRVRVSSFYADGRVFTGGIQSSATAA